MLSLYFFSVLSLLSPISCFLFKHHNNQELLTVLDGVHKACPNITRIYTLSETSVKGVPLYMIEFSTTPGQHVPRKFSAFSLKNRKSEIRLIPAFYFPQSNRSSSTLLTCTETRFWAASCFSSWRITCAKSTMKRIPWSTPFCNGRGST